MRLLFGSTSTVTVLPSSGGEENCSRPPAKFFAGTSGAGAGGISLKDTPSFPFNSSVIGLNDREPAKAKAVVISGLAIKFIVVCCPSFLAGKFLL